MTRKTLGGVKAVHNGKGESERVLLGAGSGAPGAAGGTLPRPNLVIYSNISATKTQDAVRWSIEELWLEGRGRVYMWTFTMPSAMPAMWFGRTWNKFIERAYKGMGKWPGIRVFEWHREHGLHCHMLTNRRLPVAMIRRYWESVGGGRLHVCRVWTQQDAMYVAKYIGKDHGKMLAGMRQWARLGGAGVKVKQVRRECPEQRFIYEELAAVRCPTRRDRWYAMQRGIKRYHREVTAWRGVGVQSGGLHGVT